ncbi:MAG: arsenate reductase ArsC [Lactobacillus sp.]|nr:arsenate reductase ArsC [Lactobacillus sp.]
MTKPKIAFICTHNACRSQIAEALGKHLAGDVFESYSAGTQIKDQINPDAVRLMKKIYGIDMEASGQYNKTLDALPAVDGVITMGCGVKCPYLPTKWRVDWGLNDPTGQADVEFIKVINQIEKNILMLKDKIEQGVSYP